MDDLITHVLRIPTRHFRNFAAHGKLFAHDLVAIAALENLKNYSAKVIPLSPNSSLHSSFRDGEGLCATSGLYAIGVLKVDCKD